MTYVISALKAALLSAEEQTILILLKETLTRILKLNGAND